MERLGRRITVWRGEALCVPVAASIGFCVSHYFLGGESPLGWVLHCISLVEGSWETRLPPFFCRSRNAIQWHFLDPRFAPQTLVCSTLTLSVCSVCPEMATPADSGIVFLEKFGQIPQVCLSCLHTLSHERMLAQWWGLDWPAMLRTSIWLCFRSCNLMKSSGVLGFFWVYWFFS